MYNLNLQSRQILDYTVQYMHYGVSKKIEPPNSTCPKGADYNYIKRINYIMSVE